MDEEDIRIYLHNVLVTIFPGFSIAYNPPGNVLFERPCIIYKPLEIEPSYASNVGYIMGMKYEVVILSDLPGLYGQSWALYDRRDITVRTHKTYTHEDINHDVFVVSVNTI